MAHQVTVDIERVSPSGAGYEPVARQAVSLEPISRTDRPPRGGHRFLVPQGLVVASGHRVLIHGRAWAVEGVEPADGGGSLVTVVPAYDQATGVPAPAPALPAQPPPQAQTTAPPPAAREVRVSLLDEQGAVRALGWATLAEQGDGTAALTLRHEYPGVAPAAGWRVILSRGGQALTVLSAEGKALRVAGSGAPLTAPAAPEAQAEPAPAPEAPRPARKRTAPPAAPSQEV